MYVNLVVARMHEGLALSKNKSFKLRASSAIATTGNVLEQKLGNTRCPNSQSGHMVRGRFRFLVVVDHHEMLCSICLLNLKRAD
jgi:hypothetical protein